MAKEKTGQSAAAELTGRLEGALGARAPGLMDASAAYAVLVPLVEGEDGLSVLYEVRAGGMRRQPGEICFPGGKIEGSETPEACALREAREEIGLPPSSVRLLGRLDFIAHRANFILYPVLAAVDKEAAGRLSLNPAEVAETFLVPLSFLLETQPDVYRVRLVPDAGEGFPYGDLGIRRDYRWQPGFDEMPLYRWSGRAIWGITGRITRHLARTVRGLEQPPEDAQMQ